MEKKLPQEVIAAVRKLEADPSCEHDSIDEHALMGFTVYPDEVVLVIATGQKYRVRMSGLLDWFRARLAKPKTMEAQPPPNPPRSQGGSSLEGGKPKKK